MTGRPLKSGRPVRYVFIQIPRSRSADEYGVDGPGITRYSTGRIMDSLPEHELLAAKAIAAAQAVWRVSAANGFDATLKQALRTHAATITSGVAGLPASTGRQQRERREHLAATSAGIRTLLTLARTLGLITPENASRISETYEWIFQHLASRGADDRMARWEDGGQRMNGRQRRILDHLVANGRAQIKELRELFDTEISEKTIRRDLWHLVATGFVRRTGDNRWATYVSIGH